MAIYFSPGPLCDSCQYCTIQQRPVRHHQPFKPVSISSITGIVFKTYEYSANQLADAFENLVPDHMDFEIKSQALDRWSVLFPELNDGPIWRDNEFDLKDTFSVLDDFLFLRALQDSCRVEWVAESHKGWTRGCVGWCEPGKYTNREPTQWIRIVRPTVQKPRTVQDIMSTLIHEMCHAIFAFRCNCFHCQCPLNKINGDGLNGHGPSWEKLRRSVERTADVYLNWSSEDFMLCYPNESEAANERKKNAKMLSGLYKKVTQQGSDSAVLKRLERERTYIQETNMSAQIEKDQTEGSQLEIITCAAAMFEALERTTI